MKQQKRKTYLITGSAGFIGANLVERLLRSSSAIIVCVDNCNAYYDTSLKKHRLNEIKSINAPGRYVF